MYKAVVALATVAAVAIGSLAQTAQACVDDEPCPPRVPDYRQYIPKGIPAMPPIPKGIPAIPPMPPMPKGSMPKLPPIPKGLPKAPVKAAKEKAPRKVEGADASRAAPKASDSDVKVVEKPASVRAPEPPTPVCTRYMPSLGKAVEIPCE
jgi:hypothetical protein